VGIVEQAGGAVSSFKSVLAGKLHPRRLITHEFRLEELMKAYDTFGNAAREKALKVLISSNA